jgi:FtsP/CotA-like multicopper oxidase with cupredoxin domain
MTTIRTWRDGRVQDVPADDPQLAEQEATRVRLIHVANMRRLDLRGRRDYLANVERREGLPARLALQDAFGADWEARRAKA